MSVIIRRMNIQNSKRRKIETEEVGDCQVCTEPFNRSTRRAVECPKCEESFCRSCVKTFIATEPVTECKCMACAHPWSRKFLSSVMQKNYMATGYRDHREKLLVDHEKSLLPATLPFVQAIVQKNEKVVEMDRLKKEIKKMQHQVSVMETEVWRINNYVYTGVRSGEREAKDKDNGFITRGCCPQPDCNGLISDGWACCSCKTKVCSRCLEPSHPETACNEQVVQNVQAIRQNSKPCPKCRTRIQRISGCNQIFCTNCHTPFNWSTLKIITSGFFHNPHAAEWMARTGEQLHIGGTNHNNACITHSQIRIRVQNSSESERAGDDCRKLYQYLNAANHILEYNTRVPERDYKFRLERIRFLMNSTTEKEFAVNIQRLDKSTEKRTEVAQVYEMYGNVCRDILRQYVEDETLTVDDVRKRIRNLYTYTTNSLKEVNRSYSGQDGYVHFQFARHYHHNQTT